MAATPTATDDVDRRRSPYGGIATRAVALAIDTAIISIGLFVIGGLLALVGSLVGGVELGPLAKIGLGTVTLVVSAAYFVFSWVATGQTLGQRMMLLRVVDHRGQTPKFIRSVVRVVMMGLCILFAFLGFVPVLFTRRRRGIHDMVARTTVRYDEQPMFVGPVHATLPAHTPLPTPVPAPALGQATTASPLDRATST